MKAIIDRFHYLMETLPSIFQNMPDTAFDVPTGENKWTKKQVLGHLIDSAANNHQRFIRAQYEQGPTIFYNADAWNALNRYNELPLRHIVNFWTIYNQHLLSLMTTMPAESLLKKCYCGDKEPLTLQFIMEDYVHHLEHHLKQITDY